MILLSVLCEEVSNAQAKTESQTVGALSGRADETSFTGEGYLQQ